VHVAEHVRVPADQLVHDARGHVVDREPGTVGALRGDPGVKHDLEEDIAKLVAQGRLLAPLQRLQGLKALFQKAGGKRLMRLAGVPGTGHPQRVHDLDQTQQRGAWCLSGLG